MQERHYVIVFDVSNDRRRRKLTKILLNYSYRVQFSVFEMNLKDSSVKDKMEKEIAAIVSPDEDSVIIYEFGSDAWNKKATIGIVKNERKLCEDSYIMI